MSQYKHASVSQNQTERKPESSMQKLMHGNFVTDMRREILKYLNLIDAVRWMVINKKCRNMILEIFRASFIPEEEITSTLSHEIIQHYLNLEPPVAKQARPYIIDASEPTLTLSRVISQKY